MTFLLFQIMSYKKTVSLPQRESLVFVKVISPFQRDLQTVYSWPKHKSAHVPGSQYSPHTAALRLVKELKTPGQSLVNFLWREIVFENTL